MKNRDSLVLAIGLIMILAITALIVWGNSEFMNLSAKESEAVNYLVIQQRDMQIKKLVRQLKEKEARLERIRTEIAEIKRSDIKTEAQPGAPGAVSAGPENISDKKM